MTNIILGHRGLLGSALHRLIPDAATFPRSVDLRKQSQVYAMFQSLRDTRGPADVVYMAAGRVGGIQANIERPADFIADNLAIALNVVEACRVHEVRLLVMPGSSCMYPRFLTIEADGHREDDMLSGSPEPTNAPYALAKLAAFQLCASYRRQHGLDYLAPVPCNLYGPGDNYAPGVSHFVPALIRRIHEAKEASAPFVRILGSGRPRRELMHVDDCARIIVALVQREVRGVINIGPGVDKTIRDWAVLISQAIDYRGGFAFDQVAPEGVRAKRLNIDKMRSYQIGPEISPAVGFQQTYEAFKAGERRK